VAVFLTGRQGRPRGNALFAAASAALLLFPATGCRSPKEKRGIVLVVLDSLRRDHLSHFGYERPTSPFLDGLMRRGVLFRNVYSAAPQTVPSVASLLTGLYPYRHGSHFFASHQSYHPTRPISDGGLPRLKKDRLLLAEAFKEHGYRTAAVSANPGIRDIYGFSRGIEHFRHIDCFAEGSRGLCDGRAVNTLLAEDILPKIGDDNFFVYLHYMDVHYPYYKPHSFRGRFAEYRGTPFYVNGPAPSLSADEVAYSQACYDEGVIHQDNVLRELFAILKQRGRLDDTLVAVVSDHGDEFLEHGGLGHGTTCYNELVHSFILFSHPRLDARDIGGAASLADVFPTLLDWEDIRAPKDLDGISLVRRFSDPATDSAGQGRVFFTELGDIKALVDGNLKCIYNFKLDKAELYDLDSDPEETDNVSIRRKEELHRYAAELKILFRKMAVSYMEGRLTEQEKRNLRSLGYIR